MGPAGTNGTNGTDGAPGPTGPAGPAGTTRVPFFGSSYFTNNSTTFIGMGEAGAESKVAIPTPLSGTIGGLQVRTNVAAGNGSRGYTFTVYVNGSATGVTCSIAGPSQQNCSDTGNSVVVSAGDRITLQSSPNSNPTAVSVTWSYYIDQ